MKSKLSIIFIAACLLTGCAGPISERHSKEPPELLYSPDDGNKLIKMAEKRFGKLTEADKKLFSAVAAAEVANYAEGGDKDKPEDTNSWGEKRIIDANRIEWLCRDRQAKELVTDKGIWVTEVKIKGAVDLSFAEISFPLIFQGCVFTEEINMQCSRIKFLNLMGSHTGSILADGVKVEVGVFLRDGFKANGEVRFLGAAIGEDFDCNNGEFINKSGEAISAYRMDVKGTVFLKNGFKANGGVNFLGAAIGGDFDCTNGEFINKGGAAIIADRMEVKGAVFLIDDFNANGEVRFVGATIGGDFVCNNGEFINEGDIAISADGMNVKGAVYLRDDFKANGEVRFPGAAVGVDFDCKNGKFINKDGKAIFADGMDVKGCVYLRNGFNANGEVRFSGAAIGGDFDCTNGEFINEGGTAILADRMDVKSRVFLGNGFNVEGRVSLVGATVGGSFIWKDVNLPERTMLDLRNAKAGVLWDDEKSWPKNGNLFLDGFVYESICDDAPKDAKSRIEWLDRQGDERFRPGPYEQLAKVLEKMGHNDDAIKIRIEKEEKLTRLNRFGWWTRLWKGTTIGYGYRPWWALRFIGSFILIGFFIFWGGHKAGVIVPMEKDAYVSGQGGQLREGYPKFSFLGALVYSIDMFVPVLDLRMAKYWIPDANKSGKFLRFIPVRGDFVRGYMWLHIIAGWILTTLLIVGLTGLIK